MWLNVIYAKLNCEPMQSAVSSSGTCDLWGDHRDLYLSCDLHCTSCWHFQLIFADLVLEWIFADSGSQPFPPPFLGVFVLVSMGSGEYFPLNSFSMTMPVSSCMQQWFLLARLPWIPPCHVWGAQVPIQPLRHQFPSSSIDDEFKYSVSRGMNGPNQTQPTTKSFAKCTCPFTLCKCHRPVIFSWL